MDQRSVLKQHVDLVRHCQGIIHYKTMQKWQHPSPLNEFCLASRLLATPVFRLIVMEHDCPSISRSLPAFFLLFLPRLVLLFSPALPISLLGILPCIIHEWHACFTRHVPTALLWRPEGVSTKPACNLLTQGAASSQLSSPITFISWTGPFPWHQVCCDHCVI